ncbi:protein kinase domain-containing protein [Leptolyngbya sp. AN02str]|uniref:protein kinase domain-containing protein n=1 Tax=Leptolyngbya sp. AN02str TaxID=3423363 RepID=UPI003D30F7ED
MEVYCTRPGCSRPVNQFADLDQAATLRTVQQKFCTACGMPQILAGRYVTTRLLGKGGFGAAFLARDRYTPAMRECVVKQFQPSGDLSSTQLQMAQTLFEREAQVLELLGNQHPQIPDLLAFFEIDAPGQVPGKSERYFYLVQEFIDGLNLEEELAQRGPYSEEAVTEVLSEVLKILTFVHEHNSIHRDIKPSNIMRRKDGRLFLLDFGAVKQVTAAAGSPGGKASTGIYSMGFAPPEQMRGDVVYPATDLYALAVSCITLLTGMQPSELYDAYSNSWKWKDQVKVSPHLAQILDRMLELTPSQRPQSAAEVLEQLRQLPPASAAPVSHPTPAPSGTLGSAAGGSATGGAVMGQVASTSLQGSGNPAPATIPPVAAPSPVATPSRSRSLLEYLTGAAFTGFEGGLLAIGLLSLLGTSIVSPVFWVLWLFFISGLIFAQSRRWIERLDLVIIAGITLALVVLFPFLNSVLPSTTGTNIGSALYTVAILGILTGLAAIAIAIVFRLVYLLISKVL